VNGDFSPGRVRRVHELEVTVDSVLLGWHVHRVNPEVACVSLRDSDPQRTPFVLSTTDGSRIRAVAVHGQGERVEVTEPIVGTFALAFRSLVELAAGAAGESAAPQKSGSDELR
jgi:hypothetical protein